MIIHVRKCPRCIEERSEEEVLCASCGWDLTSEPLVFPGQINIDPDIVTTLSTLRFCLNGHPLEEGDEICFLANCGAIAAEEACTTENVQLTETVIDGWSVIDRLGNDNGIFESFIVERHNHRASLTFYFPDTHPNPAIYEVLKRLPKDYVPELLAHGEWEGRRYEVVDFITKADLSDLITESVTVDTIHQIVKSVGKILGILTDNGLRHGNLCPENILINNRDALTLLLTGFQYSLLSNFELDIVTQPISARYTAPEVIAVFVNKVVASVY